MDDDSQDSQPQTSRRHAIQVVSGLTAMGIFGTSTSTTVTAAPGDQEWAFETGSRIESSPTIVDGTVFIGSGDNNLYAVDTESGEQQWIFETGGAVQSSPNVVDDTVFVGSNDNNLYAIDTESGEQQWIFETGGAVQSSPTAVADTVFVGSNDNNLYAIDIESGEQQWAFETGGAVQSSPTVVDDTVFVGSNDNNLYAIDTKSGEQQWVFETTDVIQSSPTVANGTVFIGGNDGSLYAVEIENGEQQWIFETGGAVQSSPTVVDSTVFVGSNDNSLYAITAATGKQQWKLPIDGNASSPTVVDGVVFVVGALTLYAVDAEVGDRQWNLEALGYVDDPAPTVANGTVFFGSSDSNLYAIDAGADGSSEDSRVLLGTLGHHDNRRYTMSSTQTQNDGSTSDGTDLINMILMGAGISTLGGYGYYRLRSDSSDGGATRKNKDSDGTIEHDSTVPDSNEPVTTDENDGSDWSAAAAKIPETIPETNRLSIVYTDIEKGDPLGSGGNADVYAATVETDDGKIDIALKEPRMSGTIDSETIDEMLAEAETWQRLDGHDHIVSVVAFDSDPLPWIGMEYMDGGDLSERTGDMPFEQALWTALSITKAVRHAHRNGVAHLDLKPENILFRSVPDAWDVPKVADWGLSKQLLEHSRSVDGMSPHYAAPEQFNTEKFGQTDSVTDVYQLGAVFYELFTGQPPFDGETFEVINKIQSEEPVPPSRIVDLPSAIDEILLTALATEKDDRYEDVIYLRDALQDLS